MTVREILAVFPARPILGCPGRFTIRTDAGFTYDSLQGEGLGISSYRSSAAPDEVFICALSDGGLISYKKADGRMIHTVNDPQGFRRKLDKLGISFQGRPMSNKVMPALFVGHGSPMNAIEDNAFSRAWAAAGSRLPRPDAVLCVSAHWETVGSRMTSAGRPGTIHDFYGFPDPLYRVEYPAPGQPGLLAETAEAVSRELPETRIAGDPEWGLDHGSWSVLRRMFPEADIPVVQLSLDRTKPPAFHYALGRSLRGLREKGIMILGSGNIVHNLRMMRAGGESYPWAVDFDEKIARFIRDGNDEGTVGYEKLGEAARLSVPTNEHFLPLLYVLGLRGPNDHLDFFAEGMALGSVSMRSFILERK